MIYFDNSATTKVYDEVLEEIVDAMKNNFANSSSLHRLGYETEQRVIKAKKYITIKNLGQ